MAKTNEELLQTPHGMYVSPLDQQRLHMLRILLIPSACPSCGVTSNVFTAARLELDDWHIGLPLGEGYLQAVDDDHRFICWNCHVELRWVVPIIKVGSGWMWGLARAEQERNQARVPKPQEPGHPGR